MHVSINLASNWLNFVIVILLLISSVLLLLLDALKAWGLCLSRKGRLVLGFGGGFAEFDWRIALND